MWSEISRIKRSLCQRGTNSPPPCLGAKCPQMSLGPGWILLPSPGLGQVTASLTILLMQPSPEIYIGLAAAALQASSCVPSFIQQHLANIPYPGPVLGVSGCLMLRPALKEFPSCPVCICTSNSFSRLVPSHAWTDCRGAQCREASDATGLVGGEEFQTAFIGKKMLELGLEGIHQGERGMIFHREGTASAKVKDRLAVRGSFWLSQSVSCSVGSDTLRPYGL